MCALLAEHPMYGLRFDGKRHDIGNKLDFLKTNLHYALKSPEMHDDLMEYMRELVKMAAGS
jgi:UTP--glucose-1-phosphate uridylyltransferase